MTVPESTIVLFSSHSWAHGHQRDGLHRLLSADWIKGPDFIDISIPEAHPVDAATKRGLACELSRRIAASDALLVLAGMYANYSDWMKREVNFAIAHGIPIIPIAPLGQERIAATATDFATHDTVYWRGDSIRAAILRSITASRRDAFHRVRAARQRVFMQVMTAALRPPPPQRFPGSSGALRPPASPGLWSLPLAMTPRSKL